MGEAQLQAELKRLETAKKTREASEELARFVKAQETNDALVNKQPENPYLSSGLPKNACCTIS